jgi:hypothetical protein
VLALVGGELVRVLVLDRHQAGDVAEAGPAGSIP